MNFAMKTMTTIRRWMSGAAPAVVMALAGSRLHGAPQVGNWQPLYKGIELMRGTNTVSSGDFQNRMVMHCLRVDLRDPDIRLHPTPALTNRVEGVRETAGRTVSRFVETEGVQVAVNANFFDPEEYYLPERTPMTVWGLQVNGGAVVSAQTDSRYISSFLFDAANRPTVVHTNWPAVSTAGVHTAVTGDYPVVVKGVNIGRQYLNQPGFIHGTNPRTAMGVSADGRYLYLMCIDGRQPHSTGALDYETGAWMLLVGAHDAANMDGGGSATMSARTASGSAIRLNHPSAVADSGKERTVGSHFGVYARPLPGFINDIAVFPDDVSASITWTTTAPATTQVEYGTTPELGQSTALQAGGRTRHSVLLKGLQPGGTYYFRALSTGASDGQTRVSEVQRVDLLNFAVPQAVIPIDGAWHYRGGDPGDAGWAAVAGGGSGWEGPGNGVLYVNTRSSLPASGVVPVGTRVTTINPGTGFPYITYYFRTQFDAGQVVPGTRLLFTGRIDDGAVLHLNGKELYRLRMPEAPAVIDPSTLASGFACGGDATCDDVFEVSGDGLLKAGQNVIAVEVHNYNARSPDISFGLALSLSHPRVELPELRVAEGPAGMRLEWSRGGFALEEAPSPSGPWTPVPGPVVVGPFDLTKDDGGRFYRLAR